MAYGVQVKDEAVKFISCLRHYGYEPKYRRPKTYRNGEKETLRRIPWGVGISMDVVRIVSNNKLDVVVLGSSEPELIDLCEWIKERGVKCVVVSCGIPKETRDAPIFGQRFRRVFLKKQIQPNRWSCLATSFAMVLDINVTDLYEEIGHDGSKIIWPGAKFPYDRRGFHIQELIECCLRRGRFVTPIEPRPLLASPETGQQYEVKIGDAESRMSYHMQGQEGVLQGVINGGRHAVAWDGERILDPSGKHTTFDNFAVQMFYLIRIGC